METLDRFRRPGLAPLSGRARVLLSALASSEVRGGLRLNELAEVCDMPRSTIGAALSRMEVAGAVVQRAGTTTITERGRRLLREAEAALPPAGSYNRPAHRSEELDLGDLPIADLTPLAAVERLQALEDTGLVPPGEQPRSPELDRLAALARRWTGAPWAFVTLLTRRELRIAAAATDGEGPAHGTRLPTEESLCREVVLRNTELSLADAATDPRGRSCPLVTAGVIGAYLGIPLRSVDEHVLGTLCLVDPEPRRWTDKDRAVARGVAQLAQAEMRLRARVRVRAA